MKVCFGFVMGQARLLYSFSNVRLGVAGSVPYIP